MKKPAMETAKVDAPDSEIGLIGAALSEECVLLELGEIGPKFFESVHARRAYSALEKACQNRESTHPGVIGPKLGDGYQEFLQLCLEAHNNPEGGDVSIEVAKQWAKEANKNAQVKFSSSQLKLFQQGAISGAEFQESVSGWTGIAANDTDRTVMELLDDVLDHEKRANSIIKTGVRAYEEICGGLKRGELFCLAAKTGGGKSTFATHLAKTIAGAHGGQDFKGQEVEPRNVSFMTMEMSDADIAGLSLASGARVDCSELFKATAISIDAARRLRAEAERNNWGSRLRVGEYPGLKPEKAINRIAYLSKVKKVDVFIIDYLQLMNIPLKGQTRDAAIGMVTRTLKAAARAYNVAIVILAQVNRSGQTNDGDLRTSDLRESGNIEQDCTVVTFVDRHRPFSNIHETPTINLASKANDCPSGTPIVCDLNTVKNRFGRTGSVEYLWRRDCHIFDESGFPTGDSFQRLMARSTHG